MSSRSPQSAQEGRSLEEADERRKQLNRRAQKAFRERRSEHMAKLEVTLARMQKDLHESQEAQSKAKEELLMVKYKNSLLERLLVENGIDVHRELTSPRPSKQRRDRSSGESRSHRSHKRRRIGERDAASVTIQSSNDLEDMQLNNSFIPVDASNTTINLAGMSRTDMINLLAAFSHPGKYSSHHHALFTREPSGPRLTSSSRPRCVTASPSPESPPTRSSISPSITRQVFPSLSSFTCYRTLFVLD